MKLLTVRDVSAIIQAKPSTVYAWAETGRIPCHKLNGLLRFAEDEILAWIKNCRFDPAECYNASTSGRPGKEDRF